MTGRTEIMTEITEKLTETLTEITEIMIRPVIFYFLINFK